MVAVTALIWLAWAAKRMPAGQVLGRTLLVIFVPAVGAIAWLVGDLRAGAAARRRSELAGRPA